MKVIDQYKLATGIGCFGLVFAIIGGVWLALDSQPAIHQWNQNQTDKDLENQTRIKELEAKKALADSAIQNKTGLYDQFKILGWTANPNNPPNIDWSLTPSTERKTVLDQYDKCVGYVQNGMFYSIYEYQGYPGIQYQQDACSKENRTK
jgi:hypothetical protein